MLQYIHPHIHKQFFIKFINIIILNLTFYSAQLIKNLMNKNYLNTFFKFN